MSTAHQSTKTFQAEVRKYYRMHGRDLPWRHAEKNGRFDPYKILVSEIMLQQTQVSRVIPKYAEFLKRFPNVHRLADAEMAEVLKLWNGLGYNRRAKFLWLAAQEVQNSYGGIIPETESELISLPGVGKNTAGAVLAYAFNQPSVLVETNIRTVFMHHFFKNDIEVTDRQILEKVSETINVQNPREWYWALMDYGSHLKATQPKHLHRAKAHVKQAKFDGSTRQVRGKILRLLGDSPWSRQELEAELSDERSPEIIDQLAGEKLIHIHAGVVSLG